MIAIGAAVSRLPPNLVDAIDYPEKYQDRPDQTCDAYISLYEAIFALPNEQRAAALEGLLRGDG